MREACIERAFAIAGRYHKHILEHLKELSKLLNEIEQDIERLANKNYDVSRVLEEIDKATKAYLSLEENLYSAIHELYLTVAENRVNDQQKPTTRRGYFVPER